MTASAALESFLEGKHGTALPAAIFSGALFAVCFALYLFVTRVGASLPDPARLLQGTSKFMRHVKLKPGTDTNAAALSMLIEAAYSDIEALVEHGQPR